METIEVLYKKKPLKLLKSFKYDNISKFHTRRKVVVHHTNARTWWMIRYVFTKLWYWDGLIRYHVLWLFVDLIVKVSSKFMAIVINVMRCLWHVMEFAKLNIGLMVFVNFCYRDVFYCVLWYPNGITIYSYFLILMTYMCTLWYTVMCSYRSLR